MMLRGKAMLFNAPDGVTQMAVMIPNALQMSALAEVGQCCTRQGESWMPARLGYYRRAAEVI
jgi:hypothetical protein